MLHCHSSTRRWWRWPRDSASLVWPPSTIGTFRSCVRDIARHSNSCPEEADAMSGPVILVSGAVLPPQLEQIKAAAAGADLRYYATAKELEEHVADAEVVAGNLSAAGLAKATKLKWVQ